MIVTCPNCQTRYNLPDEKIPAGGAKVKCSKCAHVFKAELPPATPEDEVENLLEEESQAPDTQAGDEFDETFDEVAAGDGPTDEASDEEAQADDAPEEEESMDGLFGDDDPASEESPDDDMPGMDDLFDDTDDVPAPDEGVSPSAGADEATADDVESLFGDDDDGLFDGDDDEGGDDDSGLFEDADEDAGGLFAEDDDDDEEDDDEGDDEDSGGSGFGLDDDAEPEAKKKGGKSLGCLIVILVLALVLGAAVYFKAWTLLGLDLGSYFQNVPYIGKLFMEETGDDEAAPGESPADKVRKIELKNVRQYYVPNEKVGNIFVVEGHAINKFPTPKEGIKVEIVLYDGDHKVLASQSFLCGNQLSQFQLQVQTRKEIEDGMASNVGILSNNTFVRPGASVPFMAVFFDPPANVKEFSVKVVDVGDPE